MDKSVNFVKLLLLISFITLGFAEETPVVPPALPKDIESAVPQSEVLIPQDSASYKTVLLFGALTTYGTLEGGISIRSKRGAKGRALDWTVYAPKASITLAPFEGGVPLLCLDYNFLYFWNKKVISPYLSWGFGAAYFIPYVPLRAGVQFKYGFIDFGEKLVLGFIPFPEARAGIGFSF